MKGASFCKVFIALFCLLVTGAQTTFPSLHQWQETREDDALSISATIQWESLSNSSAPKEHHHDPDHCLICQTIAHHLSYATVSVFTSSICYEPTFEVSVLKEQHRHSFLRDQLSLARAPPHLAV